MTEGLTPKREKFAQCVASGLDQSAAYRAAFAVRPGSLPSSINVNASKLMADAKVRQRVAELRAPIVEKAGMTLESHLSDLESLRDEAKQLGQMGAAITAEIARGRHSGVAVPDKAAPPGVAVQVNVSQATPEQLRAIASLKLPNAAD